MFERFQEEYKKAQEKLKEQQLEKDRLQQEKVAAAAAREQERLQQEAQKILDEKNRLLSLDDKGLMVELILATRGLYSKLESIQKQQKNLSDRVVYVEEELPSIHNDISDLDRRVRYLDD